MRDAKRTMCARRAGRTFVGMKGHKHSAEVLEKKSKAMRRWYRLHRAEYAARVARMKAAGMYKLIARKARATFEAAKREGRTFRRGHKWTPEKRARLSKVLKRWHRLHRAEDLAKFARMKAAGVYELIGRKVRVAVERNRPLRRMAEREELRKQEALQARRIVREARAFREAKADLLGLFARLRGGDA